MFTAARELWRAVRHGRPVRGKGRVVSRVTLPAVVDPPEDVLRALRELSEDLDMYVLPDGRVWLLKYEANKPRIREGRKILAQARELDDYGDLESAHLMAEGWSLLGEFSYVEGTSVGAMMQHAQMTLYATEQEIEADARRIKRIADGTVSRERGAALTRERIRAFAKTDWARTYRGRKVFDYHTSYNRSTT